MNIEDVKPSLGTMISPCATAMDHFIVSHKKKVEKKNLNSNLSLPYEYKGNVLLVCSYGNFTLDLHLNQQQIAKAEFRKSNIIQITLTNCDQLAKPIASVCYTSMRDYFEYYNLQYKQSVQLCTIKTLLCNQICNIGYFQIHITRYCMEQTNIGKSKFGDICDIL